jgi:hypothetical protein
LVPKIETWLLTGPWAISFSLGAVVCVFGIELSNSASHTYPFITDAGLTLSAVLIADAKLFGVLTTAAVVGEHALLTLLAVFVGVARERADLV